MIKFNIQLFGGGSSAKDFEKNDPSPGDNFLDIRIGNNTYSIPENVFKNVGNFNGRANAGKAYVASVYAAYHMAHGRSPEEAARASLAASRPGVSITNSMLNDYIFNNILKDWVISEGSEWAPPSNYRSENLQELREDNKSYARHMELAMARGTAKVNNLSYVDWRRTQPFAQPGYIAGLGAPIARDANGAFIYRNEAGIHVNAEGSPVTDLEDITSVGGDPLIFDPESGELVDPTTNEPVRFTPPQQSSPIDTAFNASYNDIFSLRKGTLGKGILDNNISLYEKQASNAGILADSSIQAQAMSQAQGIKQITDSLRQERMAQLRAGMSESQLADRELQMLMGSVGQFNAQAQMANQEATAARLGATTAREEAFNDYITQGTALGQNAAAFYASSTGNIMAQAEKYRADQKRLFGIDIPLSDAINIVSGQNNTN